MNGVLSEVNLGRVTGARILLPNNDARLSFPTLAERSPQPLRRLHDGGHTERCAVQEGADRRPGT